MYAATVTGSPVENACRLIKEYEPRAAATTAPRWRSSAATRTASPTVDSPIVIRTADVDLDGRLRSPPGATLVRDSDPAYEVAETHAKAGGILSAFGLVPAAAGARGRGRRADPRRGRADRAQLPQPAALDVLADRPGRRAARPARCGAGRVVDPRRRGRLREHAAPRARRARHDLRRGPPRGLPATGALDGFDLVIVGPGPGDPRDDDDPKMQRIRAAVDALLGAGQPFLAVCLGHQALCHRLGIPLAFKDIVFQGTQSPVAHRRPHRAGRLLQHLRRPARATRRLPDGVRVEADPETGDIHLRRRAALPRHPVPRRVDPHRARLRPDPRAWWPADLTLAGLGARLSPVAIPDVVVVDHHDSYTWNLVHLVAEVTGVLPDGRPARRGDAPSEVLRALPRRALARARPPGRPGRLRRRAARCCSPAPARSSASAWACRAWSRRTAARVDRVAPAHGEVARGRPRRPRASSRGCPQRLARGPLPLARGHRAARRPGRHRVDGAAPTGGDGRPARVAAAGGRAVPPRVDPVRARRPHGRQLPGGRP